MSYLSIGWVMQIVEINDNKGVKILKNRQNVLSFSWV